MGESLITIQQGTPTIVDTALNILGTGSGGDPTACRRLVFPASVTALLAPIVYAVGDPAFCFNPIRTLNLDNRVLSHPVIRTVLTLGTTKVIRSERDDDDVIVTEIWEANGGASMPTSFFRLLFDYVTNSNLIPADGPDFIQWEPRDRTSRIYEVVILSLTTGGNVDELDLLDIKEDRGFTGPLDGALTGLSPTTTGLVDREVRLRMKIVGEVV